VSAFQTDARILPSCSGPVRRLSRPSTRGREPASERDDGDAVDERAAPVDLEHGDPFAVGALELGRAGDVDFVVRDALGLERRAGGLAEVTAVRGVEDEPRGYG
jgi:hypothetical protein